jgi:hypothetical protein
LNCMSSVVSIANVSVAHDVDDAHVCSEHQTSVELGC